MKKILQSLKNGSVEVIEVPMPSSVRGQLLIQTSHTLVSAGTERTLIDFGKASWINKARQQPEKVKIVLEKIQTDGLMTTVDSVRSKLAQPLPLGYCNAGKIVGVQSSGQKVQGFKEGDRVVSNGPHAEVVRVPENLCVKIPDNVSDESAAFTVLASIGLQGIRLAKPTLGESVVVTGTGLIGLLTVQLLVAQGCRVLAIDYDQEKLGLAQKFGAEICNPGLGEDPVAEGMAFSRGRGVDAVIIAAATKSSDPVSQAAKMCRKRGRIVLVGVTGLELTRADFYEKELTFQVSCSYGPGRYDPEYEEKGRDYPIGFVRWSEQRNFEAVLDLMAAGKLDVSPLISHRFKFEDAPKAYELLSGGGSVLGILLEYQGTEDRGQKTELESHEIRRRTIKINNERETSSGLPPHDSLITPVVSFIGAGNYASRILIPAFKAAGGRLQTIVTSGGTSAAIHGKKAGFAYASTDVEAMLADEQVNTVVIATRHDSHAKYLVQALQTGKHVFVEKPLCLTLAELEEIQAVYNPSSMERTEGDPDREKTTQQLSNSTAQQLLMVGFNRRFSPHGQKIMELLAGVNCPKSFVMTVNAGAIPAEHWTQDPEVGGGRIIGEACHFIDLLRFLAESPIASHSRLAMDSQNGDTVSLQLKFEDGSIGTIHYFANGSKAFPKERLEVFAGGRVLQLDNFRVLRGYGWPGFKKMALWRQDKGQKACAAAFLGAVRDGRASPIPFEEIVEVSRVSIEVASEH